MYALDKYRIDDSPSFRGLSYMTGEFINFKSWREIFDKKIFYTDKEKNNDPLLIIFFGIDKKSHFYSRFVFGYLDLIKNCGGFFSGMKAFSLVLAYYIIEVPLISKLIKMILEGEIIKAAVDKTMDIDHLLKNVKEINSFSFVFKYPFHKYCYFKKCINKICCIKKGFGCQIEFYETEENKI